MLKEVLQREEKEDWARFKEEEENIDAARVEPYIKVDKVHREKKLGFSFKKALSGRNTMRDLMSENAQRWK